MTDAPTANRRRARLLLAAIGGAVAAAAGLVLLLAGAGPLGLLAGVLLGAAAAAVVHRHSDAFVLRRCGARPVPADDVPRLHNLVEGLCIASGVPEPRLHLIEDDAPNAFALGRDPRHASLVVTAGLVRKLSRVELEGVLAHELVHIADRDTAPATVVAAVGSVVPLVARLAADPVADARRETLADVRGVEITRYPPGLRAALEKLRDDDAVVRAARSTAHLWIEPPDPAAPPGLDERIALLREL